MHFYPSEQKERLTLSQAIVKYLQAQYSEYDGVEQRFIQGIWGIFGHGNVSGISQALVEYGKDLPYHKPCNEQSMVHASTGFARAKRRKATMACTTSIGPGATNMLTGAATATICRIPVLLLPSDYYASRYSGTVLQDIDHLSSEDMSVTDTFRVVSRFFDRITRPEQILTSLPEAMRIMTNPADTGAVTIALPQDIQGYAYEYPTHFFEKRVWRIERSFPNTIRIQEAIKLLKEAKKPYIIAGGGIHYSEAWNELAAVSERFGIPVGETHAGRGAIRHGSELHIGGTGHLGTPGAGRIAEEADLVICVGTRLHDFVTGSNSAFQNPDVKFISINVSGRDAYKLGALPITADAKLALSALLEYGTTAGVQPQNDWVNIVRLEKISWDNIKLTEVYTQHAGEKMSQGHLIGILNDEMDEGDVLVAAAGTIPADLTKLFEVNGGKELHLEFGNSCMGYDIPAGIGVRLAGAEKEVYILMGDGNYQMHPMELVTAMQERTKITILLNVNYGYQSIHGHQKALVGHSLGNEFKIRDLRSGLLDEGLFIEIDYAKNAESVGLTTWVANTEEEVRKALQEAKLKENSCLIVVPTERYRSLPGSEVWWEVVGAEVTNDPKTKALVAAREEGRIKQRFYY
ncbi:MAG TPA: 3D-(3,5/4)-trihydroxycyclohexane-1,2-dione acylhydrolase (decyclizing) [Deltaproteobacteria bacterium]|nr:3D-(3,5/4)-trihydroxycyclohexane-1,2-dione acylhydrolase (decyclizing) [Deltaproteobacteria bacterium]|tara:strand:+ start:987 stop:2882 length:1896 start_codon:yes stop_codon:yes gene_type:complete